MLREAHQAMEVMNAVGGAVKDERWADAQTSLQELQQLIDTLKSDIGDKQRKIMMAPKVDKGDRE